MRDPLGRDPTQLSDARKNPQATDYLRFQRDFLADGFPCGDLADGWAIMAHDALLTAAQATWNTNVRGLPTSSEVAEQFYLFTRDHAIEGASGRFWLDPRSGNPVGRPLPVFRLGPQRPSDSFVGSYTPATDRWAPYP